MKEAISRKIKWNAAKKVYKQVKKEDLPKGIVEIVKESNNHNIVTDFFCLLVGEGDKNAKDYRLQIGLIKLCEIKLFLKMFGYENNLELMHHVNDFFEKYTSVLDLPKKNKNWETSMAKAHQIVDDHDLQFFNYNDYYQMIAAVFATPFDDVHERELYYNFAYYCQMYIVLNFYSNTHVIPDNYEVYLAKLDTQLKMIQALAKITPRDYNSFIKKINGWFNRVERKQYKIRRKIQGK